MHHDSEKKLSNSFICIEGHIYVSIYMDLHMIDAQPDSHAPTRTHECSFFERTDADIMCSFPEYDVYEITDTSHW